MPLWVPCSLYGSCPSPDLFDVPPIQWCAGGYALRLSYAAEFDPYVCLEIRARIEKQSVGRRRAFVSCSAAPQWSGRSLWLTVDAP
jgi:hypothetical protein